MRDNPTNMDDCIDIRQIIDRFEELDSDRKPWSVGWNMPGFMPDSEPSHYAEWSDARDSLIDSLGQHADEDFDAEDDAEKAKAASAPYDAAIERLQALEDGAEFGETIGKYHYFIDTVGGTDAFEDESDGVEYDQLKELLEDLKGNGGDHQWRGDWYPVTLIRDSYFEDYAQELAEDIGAVNNEATWPNNCIDWKQAARELQMDYSTVDFDGIDYWYR